MSKKFRTGLLGLALFVGGLFTGQVIAEQGNMDAAANHLRQAIQSLNQATPNKGGHRERALGLAQQALDEVEEGIGYADTH